MDQDTLINQLSSTLYKGLSFLESPEFQEIRSDLSSLTHAVTSLEQEVTDSLSAAYTVHPFDRMKEEYFGTDYKFKTIDDLEEPEDIPHQQCIDSLRGKNKELLSTSFHNLTCCDEEKISTAFSFTSAGCIVPDYNKQRKYIEFVEMARNIPIESVNQDNYMSIAKKLIGEYMKII